MLVVLLTTMAPPEIVGIAYDSGGVTTSTVTVPLVTALGVGLASALKGRNPDARWFRADRVRVADADTVRTDLRHRRLMEVVVDILKFIGGSALDVLPIAVFLFVFQWLVIGGKMPNSKQIIVGFAFVRGRPRLVPCRPRGDSVSTGSTDGRPANRPAVFI